MARGKTQEEFEKEIFELVKEEYVVLGTYKNMNTHIKMRHNSCTHEYEVTPAKFIKRGQRCPKCNGTFEITKELFTNIILDQRGKEYILSSGYNGYTKKVTIKHIDCGSKWDVNAKYFIREKQECPECKKKNKLHGKTQIFKERVNELVGDEYKVIGNYLGYNTNIRLLHIICGKPYDVTPNRFLNRKHRCRHCSKLKKKSQKEFENEVFKIVGNDYIVLSNYINNREKVLMKHNICGYKWWIRSSAFINDGTRCPQCNESKGEKRVRKWLEENNYNFIPQKEFDGLLGLCDRNLSYDFYIPDYNILIEYQGEYHDGTASNQTVEQFEKQKVHDGRKRNYANDKNIKLVEIWYWDFDRIEEILHSELNKYDLI